MLVLVGCKSRRVEVVASRHTDSVAGLRSLQSTSIEKETVWETVTIRPDTNGVLQVVASDIIRRVEKEKETIADTVHQFTGTNETQARKEETTVAMAPAANKPNKIQRFFLCGLVWCVLAGFVLLFGKYIQSKWKSAH